MKITFANPSKSTDKKVKEKKKKGSCKAFCVHAIAKRKTIAKRFKLHVNAKNDSLISTILEISWSLIKKSRILTKSFFTEKLPCYLHNKRVTEKNVFAFIHLTGKINHYIMQKLHSLLWKVGHRNSISWLDH